MSDLPRSVLVVEDYADIAALLRSGLGDEDMEVEVVTSHFERLLAATFDWSRFDGAIIDQNLGGTVTGCSIALRAESAGVAHVMILTAVEDVTCGDIPVYLKPMLFSEIRAALADA